MKMLVLFFSLMLSNVCFSQDMESLERSLSLENVDINSLKSLDSGSIDIIQSSIKNDPLFLKNFLENSQLNSDFSPLDAAVLVKAVEAKKDLKETFQANQLEEFQQFISKSVAFEANFPVAGVSRDGNINTFAVQYIAYKEVPEDSGNYIGYGLYLAFDTSSFDGQLSSSLPYLVASATISNKQLSYRARLFGFEGIGAHKLLREAMPGSNFSIDTYVGYENFKDALIEGIESNKIKISPVSISPMFEIGSFEADGIALARTHGLISMAKRLSLSDALEASSDQTNSAYSVIKDVYLEHAKISKLSKRPSIKQSKRVKALLSGIGINV